MRASLLDPSVARDEGSIKDRNWTEPVQKMDWLSGFVRAKLRS